MTVWLRPSMGLSDEADFVIHMGTGDADLILRGSVIPNYDKYRDILPGRETRGAFVVSTFAAIDGVTELDILRAMKQNRFARAPYGRLHDLVIHPTSMTAEGIPTRVMAVHFDIEIPGADWTPRSGTVDRITADEEDELVDMLKPGLELILGRFSPAPPRGGSDKRDIYPELRQGGQR